MGKRERGWWGAVAVVVAVGLTGCGHNDGSDESDLSSSRTGGVGVSNTVSSPSEMGVGDILSVQFSDSDTVSLDFDGVSSSAGFVLVMGTASTGSSGGTSIQVSTSISDVAPDIIKSVEHPEEAMTPTEILHAWLRAAEMDLSMEAPVASHVSLGKSIGLKVAEGDTETFRVLSSLSSVSSYVEVTAAAECVGDNIVAYVDTRVVDSQLTDADIDSLCATYDDIAGEEQAMIGDASDIDGDGKVHVLFTPQVNRLGAMGGGIITGYFYAGDLFARSASNPVSNAREIVYMMIPDPSGQYGTAVSQSFALSNLLPAVFPHELQHAISYNQHVFVAGGAAEKSWMNEGLAHLFEDIMGYNVENPSRYAMFLASPSSTNLVTSGSPDLQERGAAYLFFRFLYEQASDGTAFLRNMLQTSLTGVDNVEAAFAGSEEFNDFSEFFGRWTVAMALTDEGVTSDSRYVYEPRSRHSTTDNWQGVCLTCDADDNRGTLLDGVHLTTFTGLQSASIVSSAAKYFSLSSPPVRLQLQAEAGNSDFAVLIRVE